jgi:hypothetical protein
LIDTKAVTARIEALPGWAEAKAEHYKGSKRGPDKYFRTKSWVDVAAQRWKAIDHLEFPIKVLDIGAGFGYFAVVGNLYGNQIELADVPHPIYDAVTPLLGLTKQELEIKPLTPVTLQGNYDLVTAYRIVFDKGWGEDEWRFFLRDVRDNLLNEGGSVVLGFNDRRDRAFMRWACTFSRQVYRVGKHDVHLPYESL